MNKKNNLKFQGVKILEPHVHFDHRGYFFESFNDKIFDLGTTFIQDNESKSKKGCLRGIHYQISPYRQSKLVRVIKGEIQDIVVDMRENSDTYLQYISIILNDSNKHQLFIPKGFAHGFLTLSDEAIVTYKVDSIYHKSSERGINYNDPSISIVWELNNSEIFLSDKDKNLPYLKK